MDDEGLQSGRWSVPTPSSARIRLLLALWAVLLMLIAVATVSAWLTGGWPLRLIATAVLASAIAVRVKPVAHMLSELRRRRTGQQHDHDQKA